MGDMGPVSPPNFPHPTGATEATADVCPVPSKCDISTPRACANQQEDMSQDRHLRRYTSNSQLLAPTTPNTSILLPHITGPFQPLSYSRSSENLSHSYLQEQLFFTGLKCGLCLCKSTLYGLCKSQPVARGKQNQTISKGQQRGAEKHQCNRVWDVFTPCTV